MKEQISLFTAIMMMYISVTSFAANEGIDVKHRNTDLYTRGIVEVPEASISHEVLRVSFSSAGIYRLTVSGSLGSPVYISSLPADGLAPFRPSRA